MTKHQADQVAEGLRAAGWPVVYVEMSDDGKWRAVPSVMPVNVCQAALGVGRRWLGRIALDRDNLPEAARDFSGPGAEGWSAWVSGRMAAQTGRNAEAAAAYRKAIDAWTANAGTQTSLPAKLIPEPDLASAYGDLGNAQILAGNPAAAIASFDEMAKRSPSSARAIYLRGRARELAGQSEASLVDYSLASRTAFANAQDLASGEAHLYRGVLLYRRKDFPRAEEEFASALNFEIPAPLRADAEAWRHLAAVAGGACGSRELLERSLVGASPDFPKNEARAAMVSCPTLTSAGAAQRSPVQ